MKTKVAVLGGGCGGLSTAWALTATPELRERFDVTVYQLGWRLGGKGSSGRAPHAGLGGQRIEEHGLHIWFGFYDHAFRVLREAYEESGLATGDDWWTVPFQKCNGVSLYEQTDGGRWIRQGVSFPQRGGSRGGPPTRPVRPPLARALAAATRMVANGLRSELRGDGSAPRGDGSVADDAAFAETNQALLDLADELGELDTGVGLTDEPTGGDTVTRGARADRMRAMLDEAKLDKVLDLVDALRRGLTRERIAGRGSLGDRLALWQGVLQMLGATIVGIIRDGVLWHGLGAIDDEDLREWLIRHGADADMVRHTPVIRGLYDLTFAYEAGDKRRPSLAAGKGIQSMLMMINYEGAFMWRMRAGMGDVVFSPLYLALAQRGVAFEFFTTITDLHLDPARPRVVAAIELEREATIEGGVGAYQPVAKHGDWWCWPADPDRGQLSAEQPWADRLERGRDFDEVVMAIPVGGQHEVCRELAAENPRYREMLEGSRTVRTKALQLWLTKPIDELRRGAGELDPPATAYAEPFDTYCDMSHLLIPEGGGPDGPKGVAYFCAVLGDEVPDSEAVDTVRGLARDYIEQHAAAFWPGAMGPDGFDWDVLFDPEGRRGPARLEAQYARANTHGYDRYVTTEAGSVASRLHPHESGFENVVLSGDWTHNDIDGGCVEAAVISGLRAADALIGRPPQ